MQFNETDFDDESLNDIHTTYNFDSPPSNKGIAQTKGVKPIVSYDLIDVSDSNYSFTQKCFDEKDSKQYFIKMKELCLSSVNSIINTNLKSWHLYPTKGANIAKELKRINNNKFLTQNPEVMHFALYTSDEKANRETGIKSPRIHFMVGANGILYPLFYDPYHEMNP